MKLNPYHLPDGRLCPELDERVVSLGLIAEYEGISRCTAYQRFLAGHYGRPGQLQGIWTVSGSGKRCLIKARPAVLWRQRGMGRYASVPGFDPRQITGPVFCCLVSETLARRTAAGADASAPGGGAQLGQLLHELVGAFLGARGLDPLRPLPTPIPFPAQYRT
jgi:hypothetical protein